MHRVYMMLSTQDTLGLGASGGAQLDRPERLLLFLDLLVVEIAERHGTVRPGADHDDEKRDEHLDDRTDFLGGEARQQHDLQEPTARLAETGADNVDGSLGSATILAERDERHLFGRVEERVLAGLGDNDGNVAQGDQDGGGAEREVLLEHEEAHERDTDRDDGHRGDQRRLRPADATDSLATDENQQAQGDNTGTQRERPGEHELVATVREVVLPALLVVDLDKVDRDPVHDDHDADEEDVSRREDDLETFGEPELDLLLLAARLALLLAQARVIQDVLLHPAVDTDDDAAEEAHQAHQQVHGIAAGRLLGLVVAGKCTHRDQDQAAEDQGEIRANVEQRVESLGLIGTADVVGVSPEEERQDDTAPQFRHDIQKRGRPVGNNHHDGCQELRERRVRVAEDRLAALLGVRDVLLARLDVRANPLVTRLDLVLKRVQDGAVQGEEPDEERHPGVEDVGLRHLQRHLGVDKHDDDGRGQREHQLQVQDRGGRHGLEDEDILQVAQQRVVEADQEHHEDHGNHLLVLMGFDRPKRTHGYERTLGKRNAVRRTPCGGAAHPRGRRTP